MWERCPSGSLFLSAGRDPRQAGWGPGVRPPLRWEQSAYAQLMSALSHPGQRNKPPAGISPPWSPEPGARLGCPPPAVPYSHPPVRTGSWSPRQVREVHPKSVQMPPSHTARTPSTGSALGLCLAPAAGPVPSLSPAGFRGPHSRKYSRIANHVPGCLLAHSGKPCRMFCLRTSL